VENVASLRQELILCEKWLKIKYFVITNAQLMLKILTFIKPFTIL